MIITIMYPRYVPKNPLYETPQSERREFSIETKTYRKEIFLARDTATLEKIFGYPEFSSFYVPFDLPVKINPVEKGDPLDPAREILLLTTDDEQTIAVSNCNVYVMNDEGKTVHTWAIL